jgi:hypothetical protein
MQEKWGAFQGLEMSKDDEEAFISFTCFIVLFWNEKRQQKTLFSLFCCGKVLFCYFFVVLNGNLMS